VNQWSEDWLCTPGTNTLQLSYSNTSSKGIFTQGLANNNFPTLRYHKIKVAFFNDNAEVARVEEYYINNVETTEVELGDLTGISAILPNYEDHDFVLVILDDKSKEFFKQNINKIDDDLTKAIIIKSFFDSVRGIRISANDFLELAVTVMIPSLSNEGLNTIFFFLSEILGYYALDADRAKFSEKIFDKLFLISQSI
jgi:aminopeptidase N